ncbi:hypothetical protein [Terricaulis sp.]|uniref:hypothetical protein n=1 Tax=Terricaulis sp. TaxID=2768686 RepID=UPI002AC5134B|nr:hypothetical protein [Terricaulis sp.]MDZ4689940.1 hypothetical protein [Terricaulis sp.]
MKLSTRAAIAVAFSIASAAHAEPGGTSSVYGPSVERGESELEYRGAVFHGGALDGAAMHRFEAGFAFTDWWRPALIAQGVDLPGADFELSTIAVENVFDFKNTRSWPVHLGGYVEYAFAQNGGDDAIEFKLLAERRNGALTARANLIAERHVGDDASDEWEYGYAARFMWRASEHLSLGIEGFGEPEARAHYWGPRLSFPLGEASVGLGYLVGMGEAQSDGQLRIAFEIER